MILPCKAKDGKRVKQKRQMGEAGIIRKTESKLKGQVAKINKTKI